MSPAITGRKLASEEFFNHWLTIGCESKGCIDSRNPSYNPLVISEPVCLLNMIYIEPRNTKDYKVSNLDWKKQQKGVLQEFGILYALSATKKSWRWELVFFMNIWNCKS